MCKSNALHVEGSKLLHLLQFNCVPMFRQITNVIQSQSVRRSPRLSQRFVPRHNAGDSNESLERSSLVTTYHHSRVTSSSNGQNVAVLNESGQRFPTNGATDAGSVTKQLFHEKKVTRHTTSYSSTTGQPYTGSPIEVGTESSEDSDVESTSQLSGCVQASNITPSTAERFRSAKSAAFRPRRTDMPRHLFGKLCLLYTLMCTIYWIHIYPCIILTCKMLNTCVLYLYPLIW